MSDHDWMMNLVKEINFRDDSRFPLQCPLNIVDSFNPHFLENLQKLLKMNMQKSIFLDETC